MDVTPAEAATLLRDIVAGIRILRPVDPRRTWSAAAVGPVAMMADDWRVVFHAQDGSLERLEAIRCADGREGHWTRWFTQGEGNPLQLLDIDEQLALESLLHECK